jgi:chromate transporter
LFVLFAGINAVTLGGGYVIVPVIGTSLEKRGWMDETEFYDIFARAQAYPGPTALSTSILVAMRLCGKSGTIAAFFGVILPPFLAILLVSSLLTRYGSLPAVKRFLDGAGAVVPGLVGAMVWRSARRRKWTALRVIEVTVLTLLLIFFPSLSLPVLLGGIAAMYGIETLWKR